MKLIVILGAFVTSALCIWAMGISPVHKPNAITHGNIVIAAVVSTSLLPDKDLECTEEGFDLNPNGPLVPCDFLDERL